MGTSASGRTAAPACWRRNLRGAWQRQYESDISDRSRNGWIKLNGHHFGLAALEAGWDLAIYQSGYLIGMER